VVGDSSVGVDLDHADCGNKVRRDEKDEGGMRECRCKRVNRWTTGQKHNEKERPTAPTAPHRTEDTTSHLVSFWLFVSSSFSNPARSALAP